MPWGGHLNRNSQLRSNAPPMPGLPLPPISLTLIGALPEAHPCLERHPLSTGYTLLRLGDWCTVFSQDLSVADPYALRQQNELFQGFDDHRLSYPPSWMSFPDPALFAWSCLVVFLRAALDVETLRPLVSACTETRNAGMPECRNAGMPECRNAGIPECQNAGTPERRNAEILKPGTHEK